MTGRPMTEPAGLSIRPVRWAVPAAVRGRVLVLALLAWLMAFSSVLGVRTVNVVGARMLTAEQVRAAAGIRAGTPLARLDLAAVSARLSEVAPDPLGHGEQVLPGHA